MKILIGIINENETKRYSAEELAKYISRVDAEVECEIIPETSDADITLGLLSEMGLDESGVSDAMLDDLTDVSINNLKGYIAGSNDRSILYGVYDFLKSAGCMWVRPGELGEYIPSFNLKDHSFKYRMKADKPFRGECIEGAVGYEHLRDTIIWMPKVHMNLFMIEQIVPYNYMNRWYRHTVNTRLPHDDIPYEDYVEYCLKLERLVKKCGMQLHVLGHGATNEPFGVRHMISGQHYDVPEEVKQYFALVNGERELFHSSPFFTQFCMSNKYVRDRIVNWLVDYLTEKPYIDFLHFWLADSLGNQCECSECVKYHPSDLYVQMLNQLDEALTRRGNQTKIIFIMYVDTLWPPEVERLNDSSRFIMTTAYAHKIGQPYYNHSLREPIAEWQRNKPNKPGGILSHIDAWEKANFKGRKFFFEYFLYTGHYSDPGYMSFTRTLSSDLKTLDATGFDGVMSDQTQRAYFPTALPNSIVGETLYDKDFDCESYVDEYFKAAFGEKGLEVKEYLDNISNLFDYKNLELHIDVTSQDTGASDAFAKKSGIIGNTRAGELISRVPSIVDSFIPTIKECLILDNETQAESWRILSYHGEYIKRLSPIYVALADGDITLANKLLDDLIDYLSEIEMEIHPYFDLVLFVQRTKQLISGKVG